MSKLKKLLSAVLSALMLFSASAQLISAAVDAASSNGKGGAKSSGSGTALELIDIDPSTLKIHRIGGNDEELSIEDIDLSLDSVVRVSIFLDKPSASDAGYDVQGITKNAKAVSYRASLHKQQNTLTAEIEKSLGYSINVKWNFTLLTNAVSAYVRVADIPKITLLSGVKSVQLENSYEPESVKADEVQTANTSVGMTGASTAWAQGYTGAGSRIAIIDTGIDDDHQSFDSSAFDHAIDELVSEGKKVSLMTSSDIPSGLNGNGVYINSKIPYAYNYIDGNTTIDHESDHQGDHGSHVAGIAAANRYIKSGNAYVDAAETVKAVGMAPDAQLIVMKVFGSNGGAYDSDYFAALEDAIQLGCDSANLSLGSSAPGFTYSNSYQGILNKLSSSENTDMLVSISAGNSYGLTEFLSTDLYIDDISKHTGGSPGTYINSLGVAAADNIGMTDYPLVFGDDLKVFYNEYYSSGLSVDSIQTLTGTYGYVFIDAYGTADDYSAVNSAVGLRGKIVIVNRGNDISFSEKANNLVGYNPAALIIANNQPGTISMNLSGYTGSFPVVSITFSDANKIKDVSTQSSTGDYTYYTGSSCKISSDLVAGIVTNREDATISIFSSWGIPGSMLLKPEITAPGGEIYSVYGYGYDSYSGDWEGGTDQYVSFSGTSMAAPHIAGLAAVLAQYLRENGINNQDLTSKYSTRAILNSLLMSTATPMINDGAYVSLLQQGAGLAEVSEAMNASSVIMMSVDDDNLTVRTGAAADGKVKVELGEDKERTGKYTYTFTIYNLADIDLEFKLATDMFTQGIYMDDNYDLFMSSGTMLLASSATYEWEAIGVTESHDVNKDDKTDADDAQAILDYITGVNDGADLDLAAGEMDGVDGLSSYDAYLLLNWNGSAYADGIVPANGKRSVTVTVEIDDDYKGFLDAYYTSGAYVEAFTYATCVTVDDEDVSYEHEHSIPVIGFYGSWTDPSMFDNTSYVDTIYGTEKTPYSGNSITNYISIIYDTIAERFVGNPYCVEEEFPAERLAVNSSSKFVNIYYNLLRSAGTTGFAVSKTDGIGGDITSVLSSSVTGNDVTGLYYYVNGSSWQNGGVKFYSVNKSASEFGLNEDDTFRIGYYAVPEYYAMLLSDDMTSAGSGVLGASGFRKLLLENIVGNGAYIGYDFRVDDTEPTISSAVLNNDGTITFTASDNLNLAYIAVVSLDGETMYVEAAPGQSEYTISFNATDAIENARGYVAVFAGDYAGNEVAKAVKVNDNNFEEKTVYVLTSALTAGEDYLIVSRNTAGGGYALGHSGTTVATNAVTVNAATGDISNYYIDSADVAETSVWAVTGSYIFGNSGYYIGLSNNSSLVITTSSTTWSWDGTNNRLNAGRYFLRFNNGYFSVSTTQSYVYLYQKTVVTVEINPFSVSEVRVNPESLDLYKGNEVYLSAKVLPITVEDRTVTWSSSNTSVATVNSAGKVTAIDEGSATITATSNADTSVYGTCAVTVTVVDKNLNAIIWDEEGGVYFSSFNSNNLPTWNKLHSDDKALELHSAFLQSSSTLYAATLDTSTATSTIYIVNRRTYALTEVGQNYYWMTDMAKGTTNNSYASYIGMAYSFAYYLCAGPYRLDSQYNAVGVPYCGTDMSEYIGDAYIAGLALKTSGIYPEYYFLDENGIIWSTAIQMLTDEEGYGYFDFTEPTKVFETGIATSFLYQSLYYDGTYLYWSHCDGEVSELYIIDLANNKMYDAGNFGVNVWPAAGIYVNGSVAPASVDFEPIAEIKGLKPVSLNIDMQAANTRFDEEANKFARTEITEKTSASGSLNAVRVTLSPVVRPVNPVAAEIQSAAAGTTDTETYNVNVTFTADENGTTNGLVKFTFDPAEMIYISSESLDYSSLKVDAENGVVTFAFAQTDDALYAKDDVILTLTFNVKICEETFALTVEMLESGSSLGITGQTEEVEITSADHTYTSELITESTFTTPGVIRHTCSHCGDTYDEELPLKKLAKYTATLSLNDSIDINFYMSEISGDAVLTDISVVYEFGGNETTGTVTNAVSNQFVVARCAAKEMGDTVTIRVLYQGVEVKVIEYSVRKYCENMIEKNQDDPEKESLVSLCKAALDYGAYAQLRFDYRTDDLVNATYTAGTVPSTAIPDSDNIQSAEGSVSAIRKMSVSLSLESKTEINFYFLPVSGTELSDFTVELKRGDVSDSDWENVTDSVAYVPATGAYMLTIPGISAKDLDKPQYISVSYVNGNGETETKIVTYSPLCWAFKYQNGSNTNTANLAKALYNYYLAAAGHFEN